MELIREIQDIEHLVTINQLERFNYYFFSQFKEATLYYSFAGKCLMFYAEEGTVNLTDAALVIDAYFSALTGCALNGRERIQRL